MHTHIHTSTHTRIDTCLHIAPLFSDGEFDAGEQLPDFWRPAGWHVRVGSVPLPLGQ